MSVYLLDTNIVSYSIKTIYASLRMRIARELKNESLVISAVTRAELRAGQGLMQHEDKRIATIDTLLQEIPTLDWHCACADVYGELASLLAKTGQSIGIMDTQIAAQALADDLILITHNTKHFNLVPNLKCEDWTQADHLALSKRKKP